MPQVGETRIEWTDATWSPVTGCTKVSAGCKNCYAETLAERFWATQYPKVPDEGFGIPGAVNQFRSREFTDVLFHEDRLAAPLRWKKPRRVFVNSMSDLFHERLPDEAIDRIFAVMALTPRHTYQILTKRPERMQQYLSAGNRRALVQEAVERIRPSRPPQHWYHIADAALAVNPWPLRNVWAGVSVEDQAAADARIPLLLQTPAAVRFVSCEPLLSPVDLSKWMSEKSSHRSHTVIPRPPCTSRGGHSMSQPKIDWVIVGGESGPRARTMDPSWARSIRDQCVAAEVACFVKQMGSRWPGRQGRDFKGAHIDTFPEDLRLREMPHAYS